MGEFISTVPLENKIDLTRRFSKNLLDFIIILMGHSACIHSLTCIYIHKIYTRARIHIHNIYVGLEKSSCMYESRRSAGMKFVKWRRSLGSINDMRNMKAKV